MSMLSKKDRRRSEVSLSNILTIKSHSVNVLFSLLPEIYYVANSPLPKIAKHFQSYYRYKKLSLCWQTSATRFEVRSPNITIRYVRYVFLLVFYINFVPKTYHFWDIRLQKSRDLENRVRGPSKSLEMSPFDTAHTTCYWRSIVTMALSRVISETSNVEKCHDLKMRVRGHWRSLNVVLFDRMDMVSY